MTTLPRPTTLAVAKPDGAAPSVDWAAVAAHGIGRGDFAALVFSGPASVIGEVSGYGTWLAPRKFVLPDPRLAPEDDLAREHHGAAWPHPVWPTDRVRPTPGVCFVFLDDGHPAVSELQARGGVEHEHFVVLARLTMSAMLRARVRRFLARVGDRTIAVLGLGDQGTRIVRELLGAGLPIQRFVVVDDRPERQIAAANSGWRVADRSDAALQSAAIVSSPRACPLPFAQLLDEARRDGRPWMDNALPWDDRPEWTTEGAVSRTGCAARATRLDGSSLSSAEHGLQLSARVAQVCELSIAGERVPAFRAGGLAPVPLAGAPTGIDVLRPLVSDMLGHRIARVSRAFVHLDGQSNHQDAAFAILAARELLATLFPAAVADVLPASGRAALGSTALERTVVRTTTGRSLGSPYMTPAEQTGIGVLARHFCGSGSTAHPIVEIGSAIGGSTLLMAAATERDGPADGPTIISIDPDAATRPAMRALFEHSGHAPRLRQIVATSDVAIRELGAFTGRVGLVFIDGLHTRECSSADFAAYAPLVRVGGCVAFHDCDGRHAGVYRTVADVAMTARQFRLIAMIDTIAVFERLA